MSSAVAKVRLVPHPETLCAALEAIEVEVRQDGATLLLDYRMIGRIEDIVMPSKGAPERTDGLWRTTCFEAFVAEGGGYLEYNFAPSGQWAAYRFDGYREGMRDVDSAPVIEPRPDGLAARIDVVAGRVGLSAVIEAKDGTKSYWALAHPPGKPDFHHPDCFVLELPAARRG